MIQISDTGKDKEDSTTEHHDEVEVSSPTTPSPGPVVNNKGQSAEPQTTHTSQQET